MPPKSYTGKVLDTLGFGAGDVRVHKIDAIIHLGAIALERSRLEASLAYLFAVLMFTLREEKGVGEAIAVESFELVKSFSEKISLLKFATLRQIGSKTASGLTNILHRLQTAHKECSTLLHGRWTLTDEKPPRLVRYSRTVGSREKLVYESENFIEIFDKVRAAQKELNIFYKKEMEPILKPLPQTTLEDLLAAMEGENSP